MTNAKSTKKIFRANLLLSVAYMMPRQLWSMLNIRDRHHVCFERCSIIVSTFEIGMGKETTELGEVWRIINEIEGLLND